MQDEAKPSTGLGVEELEKTIWLLGRDARQNAVHSIRYMPVTLQRDAIKRLRKALRALEKDLAKEVAS